MGSPIIIILSLLVWSRSVFYYDCAAALAAAFSLSAFLFSSLAFPPLGLFFSAFELGLATKPDFFSSDLGGMGNYKARGEKGEKEKGTKMGVEVNRRRMRDGLWK